MSCESAETRPFAGKRPGPPLRKPVTEQTLREITDRIVAQRPDAAVLLFGSHARGDARNDSDVDMLVVTKTTRNPLTVAGELYIEIGDRDFGVDLIVLTPERLRARRAGFDPFLREALGQGRLLHGRID
jgi:predicted nucleotidyltransferase